MRVCGCDEYRIGIAGDAVTKQSHYSGVAQVTRHLQPRIHTFIDSREGGLEHDVQHRHRNGELNLKDVMSRAGEGDQAEELECTTHLHCARPTAAATKNQAVDEHGLVGFVCMHGIPVRGLFCNMPTHEQFSYYLLALSRLEEHTSEVRPPCSPCSATTS